ncbi:hypothetical protein G9A89_003106 [Geosiphon pyriformis]|nr:hypothetical protein G9A89_003106 [Geosiphon pyriformis]
MRHENLMNTDKFSTDGFYILHDALTVQELDCLRLECDTLINHICDNGLEIVQDFGCVIEPLNSGFLDIDRTISRNRYKYYSDVYRKFRSQIVDCDQNVDLILRKLAKLSSKFLPHCNPVYLFNEQYIIKPPKCQQARFEWHQDSEYMNEKCRSIPSIACWIALDDMNKGNGTLHIDPYPKLTNHALDIMGSKSDINLEYFIKSHAYRASFYQSTTNWTLESSKIPKDNRVAESQQPIVLEVKAGTIVFLSGFVRHCSFGNASSHFRRAFMPQYSAGIVRKPEWIDKTESARQTDVPIDEQLLALAVPCII